MIREMGGLEGGGRPDRDSREDGDVVLQGEC
jgi:hypothetical protein